jgi:two-component system sensor histidine kinase QseC
LRFRYFFIIGVVLFIVSLITIVGLYFIQMNERKESIDSRLYETAQILLSSDTLDSPHIDMDKAKQLLEFKVGKGQSENFFLVRNAAGKILFKYNILATEFEYIPLEDTWHTVNHPEKYIRVLSVNLSKLEDRSLQVGIIINKQLIVPQFFSKITWFTLLLTNGVGILIAWALANFLTRPIRRLSEFLNKSAQAENGALAIESITDSVLRPSPTSRDEFDQLVVAINQLIARVNHGLQVSRLWTYQMSHEVKTPLSIISSILSPTSQDTVSALKEKIRSQIFKISETVNSFLSWAEAQNVRPPVSHVIRISRLVNDVIDRTRLKINSKIKFDIQDDFIVAINYNQMEQVLTNLVVNAFIHGDTEPQIRIHSHDYILTVSNYGSPFPQKIIDHLGQPFNKGDSEPRDLHSMRGTGLGLAYVATVCQMNRYPLHIDHQNGITVVSIDLKSAASTE